MDEIIRILAQHLNISEDTTRQALGAVMAFLKQHLPAEVVGQLHQALPAANGLAANYEANQGTADSGGLLGMVTGLAGKLLSGQAGEASQLASMLSRAGLSMDQITKFLPKAAELLRDHVPPELYARIAGIVAAIEKPPAQV